MTFGSLFAGIGGIDLGLERAGMTCKWQVEKDDFARRVLAKHWPDVPRHDDVTTFPPKDSNPEDYKVDLICGGFPCQDISDAGRKAGLDGERSGLWFEYARIIRALRPRYVLVENVSALLIRGLDRVLGRLAEIGYDAEWACIPASRIGAPHRRDRIFIVAYPVRNGWAQAQIQTRIFDKIASTERVRRLSDWTIFGKCRRSTGGRIRLFPDAELHGVDDGFPSELDENRLRVLGNAVVPQLAEFVGTLVIEHASKGGR